MIQAAMEVELARDWLDYVTAGGVLVSLILALLALVYAKKSADSAEGSAEAAETTADAAQEEARHSRELVRIAKSQHEMLLSDRSRRPELATDLVYERTLSTAPGRIPIVLEALFRNRGDKDATGALITVFAPRDVSFKPCGPGGANPVGKALKDVEDKLFSISEEKPTHILAHPLERLPGPQNASLHLLLRFPVPGRYDIRLRLEDPGAETADDRYELTVLKSGGIEIQKAAD